MLISGSGQSASSFTFCALSMHGISRADASARLVGHHPQRGTHLPIGTAPAELGRQAPEIDAILVAEGVGTHPVLLVMMRAAETDAEDVMRPNTCSGIRGRAQMRK